MLLDMWRLPKKKAALLLILFISVCMPAGKARALPDLCIDEKLDECTTYYASKGLLGSGAAIKGCVNWVAGGCFADYDSLKSQVDICNSDLYWCEFDYGVCKAGYDICNEGYNNCITQRQSCDQEIGVMSSVVAGYLKKIVKLKKKIKRLRRR